MYKQFKIHVDCVDKTTRTTFGKTIFFGQDDDYIWTHDKAERLKRLNSFSNKDNPLHADYWRTQLCFYSPDFKQNVNRMVNFLLEKRLKRLQTLKPKKDFSPIVAKRKAARLQKKWFVYKNNLCIQDSQLKKSWALLQRKTLWSLHLL